MVPTDRDNLLPSVVQAYL